MDATSNSYTRGRSGIRWVAAVLLILLGAGLGAVLLGVFAHNAQQGVWDHLASLATGRSKTEYRSQPSVVEKIQQLRRLETVVYTMDKVVEGDRESLILPDFLAGDKLLLVAHGEVVAGIDLGGLRPSDVAITGRKIHVHLPAAQVFTSRLDSAQTRVYSRTTGLLVSADSNLESEVRQKAEQQIRESALADGILDKATQNARSTIHSMLLSLGFDAVEVD
ncbi:MAG TPA: DUF4230 domain-containing protein [Acidisarcina sp.]|nr:DUF4230 domain-containing protein [Acidisarcina sp.]